MAGKKLMTAYYELIAATPNAEKQITSAVVPAASKAGSSGGSALGSNLVAGLKKFAAPVAAALSVAGVSKFVKDSVGQFTSLTGSIVSLQRITGGTTTQVSALQGAMRLSGMDASKANTSLTQFSKKLQGVSGDSQKTAAMQQLLGTSITGANGQLKPMTELLPQVADKFKSMPDGVQKTALATQLFGRSGTAMLPFLNQGSAGIAGLEAKAKQLGITLDDSSKTKWAAYKTATRNVSLSMEGLRDTVGGALIPVFTGFSNFIANTVTPGIQSMIQWFQSPAVQDFANKAGQALADFGTKAGNVLKDVQQKLKDLFGWVSQNKDWLSAVTTGIGTVVAGFAAWTAAQAVWSAATKMATAVQAAFNVVMAVDPIVLIVAAIAALVAGLVYFFTQTQTGKQAWQAFTTFLSASVNNIKQWFANAGNGIKSVWDALVNWFGGVPGRITGFFNGIGAWFSGKFGEARNGIQNAFNGAANWVGGVPGRITGFFGSIGGWFSGKFNEVRNGIQNGFNNAVNAAKSVPGRITGIFSGAGSWLLDSGRAIIDGLANGIRGAVSGAVNAAKDVLSKISNMFPHSPAKEGPFSGRGWTLYSGQATIEGFAQGVAQRSGYLRDSITGVMSAGSAAMQLKTALKPTAYPLGSNGAVAGLAGFGGSSVTYSPHYDITQQDPSLVMAAIDARDRRNLAGLGGDL